MLSLLFRVLAQSLIALIAAVAIAGPAAAQGAREIPANALKGKLTPLQVPNVSIDGRTMRLSPGAQIFSTHRTMLTPNQVKADTPVRYVLDAQGQIRTVWIVDERSSGVERTGPQQ
jgi:hypothetical protein